MQEGIFGAKLLEEEKIIAMQAELTALMGQFVLPLSLQRATGDKKDGGKRQCQERSAKGQKEKEKEN